MDKKKVIAIVCGGDSSEHDVSLRSAQGIYSFLDKERFEVFIVEITGLTWEAHLSDNRRVKVSREDFSFQVGRRTVKPDFAYITIHGTPGENGILQGYFDLIRLPYSTSNVLVEAMTFNKFTLNQFLKGFGVSVSESLVVRRGNEDLVTDDEIIYQALMDKDEALKDGGTPLMHACAKAFCDFREHHPEVTEMHFYTDEKLARPGSTTSNQ